MNEQREPINFLAIEQVPPGPREVEPLTDEQKAKVEAVTRYERKGDYVHIAGFRKFVSPIHKSRQ